MSRELYEKLAHHFTTLGQPTPVIENTQLVELVKELFRDSEEAEMALFDDGAA